jgi:Icc-related predicted phosphoesterase
MAKSLLHISDRHCLGDVEWGSWMDKLKGRFGDVDFIAVTGDMIFNTGYWRNFQYELEAEVQRKSWVVWAEKLQEHFPTASIVAVPGNHDFCDYGIDGVVHSIDDGADTFKIKGVKFTGFRGVPRWRGYWDRELKLEVEKHLVSQLDRKADIVLTHTPPFGCLGGHHMIHFGSKPLLAWLEKNKGPKAHLFGHAHESGGIVERRDGRLFSNAACGANMIFIEDDGRILGGNEDPFGNAIIV